MNKKELQELLYELEIYGYLRECESNEELNNYFYYEKVGKVKCYCMRKNLTKKQLNIIMNFVDSVNKNNEEYCRFKKIVLIILL